jgi:deoxyadenosine/deoxycytidine kinase
MGAELVFERLENQSEQDWNQDWDNLRSLIKEVVVVKPKPEIDALLERLVTRAKQFEQEAREAYLAGNNSRSQELYRLQRRFDQIRYVVYNHLQPDWLPEEHRRGHPDFS